MSKKSITHHPITVDDDGSFVTLVTIFLGATLAGICAMLVAVNI